MTKNKKTGVFSWCGYYSDFARRLEYIRAAGFDGIMLWWEDDLSEWPYTAAQMVAMTRALGLEVFNAHIANIHENLIWSEDRVTREKHLFLIRDTIEEIAEEGLFNLVIHLCESGEVPPPGKALLSSIEYLLPYAAANKVTLSVENTWRSDYLEAVWAAFPVKEIGFCFDSSHAALRNQFDLLKNHHKKLTALHLSDNDGRFDRHWLPFDGKIDYETRVTPYLKENDVPYTMELISDKTKYPDEAAFLKEAKVRVERLLALEQK